MSSLTALKVFFKENPARNRIVFPRGIQSDLSKKNEDEILLPPNNRFVFVYEKLHKERFRPSALFFIETISPGKKGVEIKGVNPGAKLLLRVRGPAKINIAISFFNELIEKNVALNDLSDILICSIRARIEAGISLDFLAERIFEERKFS